MKYLLYIPLKYKHRDGTNNWVYGFIYGAGIKYAMAIIGILAGWTLTHIVQ